MRRLKYSTECIYIYMNIVCNVLQTRNIYVQKCKKQIVGDCKKHRHESY